MAHQADAPDGGGVLPDAGADLDVVALEQPGANGRGVDAVGHADGGELGEAVERPALFEGRAHLIEEGVAGAGQAAAQREGMRVVQGDADEQPVGEGVDGLGPDGLGPRIAGGGSGVLNLDATLRDKFSIPVSIMDPFRNVTIDEGQFNPEELAEIGPSMAIAVGLAIRKLGDA